MTFDINTLKMIQLFIQPDLPLPILFELTFTYIVPSLFLSAEPGYSILKTSILISLFFLPEPWSYSHYVWTLLLCCRTTRSCKASWARSLRASALARRAREEVGDGGGDEGAGSGSGGRSAGGGSASTYLWKEITAKYC